MIATFFFFFYIRSDNYSNRENLKNTKRHQETVPKIAINKMVQPENLESVIYTNDNNSTEVRSIDECLAVYETQVKSFANCLVECK